MTQIRQIALTSTAGKPLAMTVWVPDGEVLGAVQLVHGMAEHIGRYDRLARALNDAGFAVAGHNHLGHGPDCPKEDVGFFADKNGWSCVVEDIQLVSDAFKRLYPDQKHIILGHSMGSFAVREYIIRHPVEKQGCILSGTGWHPAALCASAIALSAVCGAVGGWHKPAPAINRVAFGANNKGFQPERTPFDWLSRDEQEVDRYVADPLCGFLFTAGAYYDMFTGLSALSHVDRLKQMHKDMPVLFISGGRDPVGADGDGVRTVYEQFRAAGMKKVTLRLYENARHELFNEINRDEVTNDVITWLRTV